MDDKLIEVQRVLEDGDPVSVHFRVQYSATGRGVTVVHIFRFEGDSIAELWDVGQPVPENSPNGMFWALRLQGG